MVGSVAEAFSSSGLSVGAAFFERDGALVVGVLRGARFLGLAAAPSDLALALSLAGVGTTATSGFPTVVTHRNGAASDSADPISTSAALGAGAGSGAAATSVGGWRLGLAL